jgi:hypothetical protein
MKSNKLSIAVGAALAALCAPATSATLFSGHELVTVIGSASALRDSIGRLLPIYCKPGAVRTYILKTAYVNTNFPGTSNGDYRAYECQFKDTTDAGYRSELGDKGLAGKKALIYHTVTYSARIGGSIVGIVPIVRNVNLNYPDVNSDTCTQDTAVSGTVTTTVNDGPTGFPRFSCNAHIAQRPEIGVSDTEPASFRGPNVALAADDPDAGKWSTDVFPPLATDDPIQAAPQNLFKVGFGIAVTKNIIDPALRATPAASNAADSFATLSSLSHSQIQSILSGQITNLNQIVPGGANKPLQVCRRTQGSGTQASFNAMVNQNPCLSSPGIGGLLTIADASFSNGTPGEYTVIESPATSGVKNCLRDAQAAGYVGVGIMSLENPEISVTTGTNTNWQFIAIDGVAPFDAATDSVDGQNDRIREDRINNGQYTYAQEPTIQWRISGPNALPAGVKTGFAEMIRDNAGDPVVSKTLPGIVSLPTWWSITGQPRTALNSGISNYSRLGNSCQPLTYQPF